MKLQKLKYWSLFYNTNGYLCLVYKITSTRIHIINTNGTIYTVNRNSECNYVTAEPEHTPESFFINFPVRIFNDHRDVERYEHIKSLYYRKDRAKINNLLLIC